MPPAIEFLAGSQIDEKRFKSRPNKTMSYLFPIKHLLGSSSPWLKSDSQLQKDRPCPYREENEERRTRYGTGTEETATRLLLDRDAGTAADGRPCVL